MSRVSVLNRQSDGPAERPDAQPAADTKRTQKKSPGFRLDIQGLRAIAVAGVVAYHLWPKALPGGFVGVDVFFVISGFLITSQLVRKPPRRLKDVGDFWVRRIKRLLPAALVVLLTTALLTFLIAPVTMWRDTGEQITAATGYVQNWVLAFQSVDYLAADNAPTAVQHFWSLSVEEQFYLVWPVIIGALGYLATRLRVQARRVLVPAIVVITAGFLVFAIWYTSHSPEMAYFITPARMWELALGGVVALLVGHLPASTTNVSTSLAWLGLGGIAFSMLFINGDMPFPGYIALLPTLSTALVIAAHATSGLSPRWLLSTKPVQFTGTTSYAIYLWHWPLIVLLPGILGDLVWWQKLAVIAVTMVLAWLTQRFIETRFRHSRFLSSTGRALLTVGIVMALAVAGGQTLRGVSIVKQDRSQQAIEKALDSGDGCVGAGKLLEKGKKGACDSKNSPEQDPAQAKNDKAEVYREHCRSEGSYSDRLVCHYGHGPTKVALVGNSHAAHWLPALQMLAKERGWTIDTYLASRCNPTTKKLDFKGDDKKADGCLDYGKWVKDKTTSKKYSAIITSERQSAPVEGHSLKNTEKAAADGYKPFLKAWHKAGTPVVAIRDSPFPKKKGVKAPDCVAQYGPNSPKCEGSEEEWGSSDPLVRAIHDQRIAGQHVIDPTHLFCPDGNCRPVIGGVIVYFDGSHTTATYSKTMAPWLGKQFQDTGIKALG